MWPNKQCSPLLRLLAELRNTIYDYVFADIEMTQQRQNVIFGQTIEKLASPPGLLLTCRTIHTETIKQFYATAKFHFEADEYILRWMCCVPRRYLEQVRSIVYHAPVGARYNYLEKFGLDVNLRLLVKYKLMKEANKVGFVFEEENFQVEFSSKRPEGRGVLELSSGYQYCSSLTGLP